MDLEPELVRGATMGNILRQVEFQKDPVDVSFVKVAPTWIMKPSALSPNQRFGDFPSCPETVLTTFSS